MAKHILILFFLLGVAFRVHAVQESSVSLTAAVSSPKVSEGETFSVEIILRWDGDLDRQFEQPVLSGTKNCSITAVTVENRLGETNGWSYSIRRYAYTLQPEGPGMAWFGTAAVRYREGSREKFLVSPDLTTEVILRKPSRRKYSFLFFLAILIVSAGVSVTTVFYFRKKPFRPGKSDSGIAEVPEDSPEEKLFTVFIGLNRASGRISAVELFDGYLRVLRDLLALRAGVAGRTLSDAELLGLTVDADTKKILSVHFETAAAVRYAGRPASLEDAASLKETLAGLFNRTKKEPSDG